MSKDELLKMLDLDGAAPAAAGTVGIEDTGAVPAGPPASDTALDLDKWGMRKGDELLESSELLAPFKDKIEANAVADFHGAAFELDPVLNDSCTDKQRHEFVKQLLDTPEYKSLHTSTALNPLASELATAAFAKQFVKLAEEIDGKPGDGKGTPGKPGLDPEIAAMKAVAAAVAEATRDVEDAKETSAAFGMGKGGSSPFDAMRCAKLFGLVRSDPSMLRIIQMAGRFRRVAASKQRKKSVHGYDDMVGVVPDGDVGRLLPSELAQLADEELELDVMRRLVERQCMCRDHRSIEPVGKGPIIVCLDESGSMSGHKIETAKALALAMAWVANRQRRWCALVAYSGDTGQRVLKLPLNRWNDAEILAWLQEFLSGGSDIDVPVREMPDIYADLNPARGKTDVIFVTDAICSPAASILDKFRAWKESVKAKLFTIVIANRDGDCGLRSVSDEWFLAPSLDCDDPGVGRVLGI